MGFQVLYSRKDSIWKITDFGFTSEGSSQRIRDSSNSRGTSGYRAPELLQGVRGSFNNKVDIWAMGCILFELAAGKKAFECDDIVLSRWLSGKQFTLILEDRALEENAKCTISDIVNRMINRNSVLRPSASAIEEEICHIETVSNGGSLQSQEFISEEAFTATSSQLNVVTNVQSLRIISAPEILGNVHAADDHTIQKGQTARPPTNPTGDLGQADSISAMSPPINQDTQLRRSIASRGLVAIQGLFMEKYTLIHAAQDGDIERVKMLLGLSFDTKIEDKSGWTALHGAAKRGHKDLVALLLDDGADITAKDIWQWTALHWAASGGHKDVVALLLDKGADIAAKDNWQWTALHWAASGGHKNVVALLLDKGADVAAKDNWQWTALHWTADRGHKDVVALVLDKGADVAAKDNWQCPALHWAARGGHKDVVVLLLDKGADVAARNNYGWTALHWAADRGYYDVVALLEKALERERRITGNVKDDYQ